MKTISFGDLVALLARGDEFQPSAVPEGFSTPKANPRFVEPSIQVLSEVDPGRTSIVLVSAPGAVGKSTLASELANRIGALLWDLSTLQVGSSTFVGSIMKAYDSHATGVTKRLHSGRFSFVLDALDEAQVRSGSQNFDAFLADVGSELQKIDPDHPRERPSVVLLARSDTAEWVELFLDDLGIPVAHFRIARFNREQAEEFIERSLFARNGEASSHLRQAAPFEEARNALFELVCGLFAQNGASSWDDERVRGFLGYAPVLEALTDYLNVGNYMPLISELQAGAGAASDPWQFLGEIVDRLLIREQTKVRDAVQGNLTAAASKEGWSEWDRLYSPEEQTARVLAQSLGVKESFGIDLSAVLSARYEDALSTIVPQHPFLRGVSFSNVVFREYVYARGVLEGSDNLATALRLRMRETESPFLPSQLFGRFFANIQGSEPALIDGQDFGVLYESIQSRSRDTDLTLLQADEEASAAIVTDGDPNSTLEVRLLDSGGGVQFWRHLRYASIDLDCHVDLGLRGQRFQLGPTVDIRSASINIESEFVELDASGRVSLSSGSYSSAAQPVRIAVRNNDDGESITIDWPNAGHPWADYRGKKPSARGELGDSVRGDALRKFLLMFRRQRSRKESTIRHARWSTHQHQDRDELLKVAQDRGVIRLNPARGFIEFNSDFDSLMSLIEGTPSLSVNSRAFVSEFLGEDEVARQLAEPT